MKVRIYQPHTHAGVRHEPGPKGIALEVSVPEAAFLKQHGVLDTPITVAVPAVATTDPIEPPPVE